ncbi:RNA-directed DNA polymerase from mobile element jockey [Xyrichtys novacula]|uniref:RNA-directed DNA polymerase from mobile element jockey n=1 Tax=Xyrichtys novacula TaxID=13765 RepID=A0AAV1FJP5_XYRNO|nr:RNA-directed DNA polymerase from mobile element jockey [Xyrichtys novacula]
MIGDLCSSQAPLSCGVPQGSLLGPILFSLYLLPLGSIIRKYNLSFHSYADDLQLYLPMRPNENSALSHLLDCITEVKQWLALNFLHLNDSKTECILFGTPSISNAASKMAPVCVACRLSLSALFLFVLFVSFVISKVSSLYVYDHQTLLDLRPSAKDLVKVDPDHCGHTTFKPFHPCGIPAHLRCTFAPFPRRKRRRRRGKRSGQQVKVKSLLARSSVVSLRRNGVGSGLFPHLRSLHPVDSWLVPVVGSDGMVRPRGPCSPRPRRRGVNPRHLRALCRAPRSADASDVPISARFGLVNARSLANKTFILKDFFMSRGLDFLCVTETWLSTGESSPLIELCPPDCCYFNSPRSSGRKGGGIAVIFKSDFKCRQICLKFSFTSFEMCLFELGCSHVVLCAVIYRPPKYNKDFISDFSEFLAEILPKYDRVLIVGDFNIHTCCPEEPVSRSLLNLIDSFNFVQSVSGSTHNLGHTLDLVLSHGLCVSNLVICDAVFSDHMPILFDIPTQCPVKLRVPPKPRRMFNSSSPALFSSTYVGLCEDDSAAPVCLDTEELVLRFHSTCLQTLDTIAPLKTRRTKPTPEPWLNDVTRAARRECRRAERRWKKDSLQVYLGILKDSLRNYQRIVKAEKNKYFSELIAFNCNNPRALFKTINTVLEAPKSLGFDASTEICEKFLHFFSDKIMSTRAFISQPSYDPSAPLHPSSVFSKFESVSLSILKDIVSHMKPSGSPADAIPPRLFKEVLATIGPNVLNIVNCSLSSGTVPRDFKHAVVRPLLKKTGLDPSLCANFRPISNLPYLSKILEKVVYNQLLPFLEDNGITELFQSGFKALHSTESALLKVSNDILMTTDSGKFVVLVLLDLSAAFDTVDHSILISRLEHCVGIKGVALDWFRSYLRDRSFCVQIDNSASSTAPLPHGVPQGSILGPLLFAFYLLPLGSVFRKHGISFHFYADDCQIYLPLAQNNSNSVHQLTDCLKDIKAWLSFNFLSLNENKTEVMLFGPSGGHPPTST